MVIQLALAVLALGADSAVREVKIHARAPWPFAAVAGGNEIVIRDAAELLKAWPRKKDDPAPEETEKKVIADVAKALKVTEIDWKSQMLIVVHVKESHPTHQPAITGLKVDGRVLTVHYQYWEAVAAREQDENPKPVAVTFMTLVDRFEGEVKFVADARLPK